MKLQILSDLHIEFGAYSVEKTDADVVILAGDIHLRERSVKWAIEQIKDKPVILVPGNHEYYGGSLGRTLGKMRLEAVGSNVHVLSDDELVLDGVRFLGATMWTDYRITGNEPLAQWDAKQTMTDFKKIRNEFYSKIIPRNLSDRHQKSRAFLDEAYARPFDGPTVVVTHHAPSQLSIHPRFKSLVDHTSASYASNLERFLGMPKLWVHGHCHDSFSYDLYGTRVVCNPRGYYGHELNQNFDSCFVVEV